MAEILVFCIFISRGLNLASSASSKPVSVNFKNRQETRRFLKFETRFHAKIAKNVLKCQKKLICFRSFDLLKIKITKIYLDE